MDKEKAVLSLLFLTVLAAGCVQSNGGDETESIGGQSISVQDLRLSPQQIYTEQSAQIWLEAENVGELTAEINPGDNKGDEILTNACSDFIDKERYSIITSRTDDENKDSYELGPGESIEINWELKHNNSGRLGVPSYGLPCELQFSMPFKYSVSAFRQVEWKQSPEVEGSPNLASRSSSGPMLLAIETIPGTTGKSSSYVPKDEEIDIMIQLVNKNPDEDINKGLVNINESSILINSTDPFNLTEGYAINASEGDGNKWNTTGYNEEDKKCEPPSQDIRLFEARSQVIRCSINITESNLDRPSVLSEIRASLNYTYNKEAGEKTLKVESRG